MSSCLDCQFVVTGPDPGQVLSEPEPGQDLSLLSISDSREIFCWFIISVCGQITF